MYSTTGLCTGTHNIITDHRKHLINEIYNIGAFTYSSKCKIHYSVSQKNANTINWLRTQGHAKRPE